MEIKHKHTFKMLSIEAQCPIDGVLLCGNDLYKYKNGNEEFYAKECNLALGHEGRCKNTWSENTSSSLS